MSEITGITFECNYYEKLVEKINVLKKNKEKISEDILKTKYKAAYNKLVNEILQYANAYIEDRINYLAVSRDKLEEFYQRCGEFSSYYKSEFKKALKDCNIARFDSLVEEYQEKYTQIWFELSVAQ